MWVDKPEDEESTEQQTSSLDSPSVGAGAGAEGGAKIQGSTTAAVGTPSSMSPTPVAPGQKFGTIQDYFKVNKSQGEKLGEQFTSKLDQAKQQQQSAIGQAAEGAKQDIASGTIATDTGLIETAAKDPTKVAGDEDQFNQFMTQWNAAYRGPQSFEASTQFGEAAKAVQSAKDKATQTESTGGRQQLIQDEFGVYGQGNKGLDEALLQQSSYFPVIGEKAKDLSSLQDYLESQSSDIATKAQEAKATTEQTKQKAQEALLGETGAVKQFKTDIDTRLAQERTTADKSLADIQKAVASNAALTDDQLNLLGINRDQYNTLIRQQKWAGEEPNLANYLTLQNPSAQLSRENVAKQEDFAKDEALAKLTGRSGLLGEQSTANPLAAFDSEAALKRYLDINEVDKATQDAVLKRWRDEQSTLSAEQAAARTAKRESSQNIAAGTPAGGALMGLTSGLSVLPGVTGPLGEELNKLIGKDKTASKIAGSIGKGSQKIIDAGKKLFGGSKKDAVVNLPQLSIPDIDIPMNADLKTTQAIKGVFTKPLNTQGSYQEGAVYDMVGRLDTLKQALASKQISDAEYNAYAQPLAKWAKDAFYSIMSASSQAATSATPAYNKFVAGGFDKLATAGKPKDGIRFFSSGGVVEAPKVQDYIKRNTR